MRLLQVAGVWEDKEEEEEGEENQNRAYKPHRKPESEKHGSVWREFTGS